MLSAKCPGQDTRYWTAEDIHEQVCPGCGVAVEFWKTDIRLRCPRCKQVITNDRFNLGCAEWCSFADKCLGDTVKGLAPRSLRQLLESELARLLGDANGLRQDIKDLLDEAEQLCRKSLLAPLPVLAALGSLLLEDLGLIKVAGEFIELLQAGGSFPEDAARQAAVIVSGVQDSQLKDKSGKLVLKLRRKHYLLQRGD